MGNQQIQNTIDSDPVNMMVPFNRIENIFSGQWVVVVTNNLQHSQPVFRGFQVRLFQHSGIVTLMAHFASCFDDHFLSFSKRSKIKTVKNPHPATRIMVAPEVRLN